MAAIRNVTDHCAEPAYLFVTEAGNVYVLAASHQCADVWSVHRRQWWRGVYGRGVTLSDIARELGELEPDYR
jgi:hypothetical protein